MKNLILAIACLFMAQIAQAQLVSLGLKAGINSPANTPDDINIGGGGDPSFNLSVDGRNFGTQFGAFLRIGKGISIQPEVLFNSNKTTYKIGESSFGEVIKNEKYQYLDFPVLMGLKLGPLRLQAGPVGHYFLKAKSQLTDIDGYEAKYKQMTWGWQGGLNVGFKRLSFDLRYEGNFSKQGNHINFFGDQYHFSNNPARFIAGINFAII